MTTTRRGYPLGALFVLVAACGVMLALVTPLAQAVATEKVRPAEVIIAVVSGVLACLSLGVMIGTFHFRALRGILVGGLTGGLIGLVAGPLVLVPASSGLQLFAASVGGSLVLLIVGMFLRLASRS